MKNTLGYAYLPDNVTIRKDTKNIVILEEDIEMAIIQDYVKIKQPEENCDNDNRYGLFNNPNTATDKNQNYVEKYKFQDFDFPIFGVTILGNSHGFDPKGTTSGYILWINGRFLFFIIYFIN